MTFFSNCYRSIASVARKLITAFALKRVLCLSIVATVAGSGIGNAGSTDPTAIKVISIVADEWYPMNGVPQSKKPGFMIEIAQQTAGDWGATIVYRVMPWNKAIELTRKGHFDCIIGAYKEDAPDFVFPKHHWGVDQIAFYAEKGKDWQFRGYQDLVDQLIGVVEGYSYGEGMDQWLVQHPDQVVRIRQNDALRLLVRMLMRDRIDLVVESQAVMMNRLNELKLETQIKEVGLLGGVNSLYLACSPHTSRLSKSQMIVDQMDQAFEKMRKVQQLEVILSRYGVNSWW